MATKRQHNIFDSETKVCDAPRSIKGREELDARVGDTCAVPPCRAIP